MQIKLSEKKVKKDDVWEDCSGEKDKRGNIRGMETLSKGCLKGRYEIRRGKVMGEQAQQSKREQAQQSKKSRNCAF